MARKKENYLDYVPAISSRNTWDVTGDIVTIHMVHRGFFPWVAQTFFGRPRVSHIDLDVHGSYIFQQINGERTVGELALLMKERFGQDAEPLYDRLVQYMKILRNNELIYYRKKGDKQK